MGKLSILKILHSNRWVKELDCELLTSSYLQSLLINLVLKGILGVLSSIIYHREKRLMGCFKGTKQVVRWGCEFRYLLQNTGLSMIPHSLERQVACASQYQPNPRGLSWERGKTYFFQYLNIM